ncbi:MAG: hypothetical protein DDT42_01907 [candidate division WS2 bacterium]|uniref:Uncharacterized protein n=1 Tax=Psychracetigena formicireducens TaxID=2986056 RepID=A0A9E2BI81_PSYF1|nr:hypothetical protein [Candidatus Psychracetigena formicireducens]
MRNQVWKKIGEDDSGQAIMELIEDIEVPDVVLPEKIEIELTPGLKKEWRLAKTQAEKLTVIAKLLKLI